MRDPSLGQFLEPLVREYERLGYGLNGVSAGDPAAGGGLSGNATSSARAGAEPSAVLTTDPDTLLVRTANRVSQQNDPDSLGNDIRASRRAIRATCRPVWRFKRIRYRDPRSWRRSHPRTKHSRPRQPNGRNARPRQPNSRSARPRKPQQPQ